MNTGYIKIILSIILYGVIISIILGKMLGTLGKNKNIYYYPFLGLAFLLSSWGVYDLFKDNPPYLKIGFAISLAVFAELITSAIRDDIASKDFTVSKQDEDKPFDPIPYYVAIPSLLLILWGFYDIVKK
jgi:hypothetical protein